MCNVACVQLLLLCQFYSPSYFLLWFVAPPPPFFSFSWSWTWHPTTNKIRTRAANFGRFPYPKSAQKQTYSNFTPKLVCMLEHFYNNHFITMALSGYNAAFFYLICRKNVWETGFRNRSSRAMSHEKAPWRLAGMLQGSLFGIFYFNLFLKPTTGWIIFWIFVWDGCKSYRRRRWASTMAINCIYRLKSWRHHLCLCIVTVVKRTLKV